MVLDDNQRSNCKLGGKKERRTAAADQNQGEDREAGGSKNRSEGNVAADRHHQKEDSDGGQGGPGRGDEKHAEAGGDALAATKMQPASEHVAEYSEESSDGLGIPECEIGREGRRNESAEPNRAAALEDIENKGGCAKSMSAGANNIGGANIPAANGADVLAPENTDQQVSKWNGSQQIRGGRDGEEGKGHNERV